MTEHVTIKSLFIHDTNSPPQKKQNKKNTFILINLVINLSLSYPGDTKQRKLMSVMVKVTAQNQFILSLNLTDIMDV